MILMSTSELAELGADLASDGITGHESAVRDVVRAARRAAVSPILTDVLADPRQPEVARLRAYGRIAAHLATLDARQQFRPPHAA
jgi:hypothetical protein